MYKTILVPLDGSKRAEAILPHVEEMARRYQARVILLQVVERTITLVSPYDAMIDIDPTDVIHQQVDDASYYLAVRRGRLRKKDIRVQTRVEVGPVTQTIIDVAKQEEADVIAMASHGRGGLSRVIYGSVAAGVLQRWDRPLLLIRSVD